MPYWAPTPKKADPTDRHNRRRRPHGRTPVILVGSSHSTAPGPAHPVPRPERSLTDRAARPVTRDPPLLPPAAPPTVIALLRAMFRQRGGKSLAVPDKRRPAGVLHQQDPPVRPSAPGPGPGRRVQPPSSRRPPSPPPGSRSSSSSAPSKARPPSTSATPGATPPRPRSLGATVTEIYSPNATWSRVKAAAEGANIFIYLGHGNGYPSPYGAFRPTDQGRARPQRDARPRQLQHTSTTARATSRRASSSHQNAVVLLNHLCYASGNSEPGRANPTKSVGEDAGRLLRRRVHPGRGACRLRERQGQPDVDHPSAADLGPDDQPDLRSSDPAFSGRADFQFALEADDGLHRLAGPVRRRAVLPLGRRQALDLRASTVRAGS